SGGNLYVRCETKPPASPVGHTFRTRYYRQISVALIPAATPVVYIGFVSNHAKDGPSMKNGGNASPWHWRRFIVDVFDRRVDGRRGVRSNRRNGGRSIYAAD